MTYRKLIDIYNSFSFAITVGDPICYEDAAKCKDWFATMKEEINAINKKSYMGVDNLTRREESNWLEVGFQVKIQS